VTKSAFDYCESWPHKWFGFWYEQGEHYKNCPSVHLFVDHSVNKTYRRKELASYLATAPVVASTSRWNFPNPLSGERSGGSLSTRTDGEWIWLDDLADLVEKNDVCIPSNWLLKIHQRLYTPPAAVSDAQLLGLDVPPIG
jgi:hypothetical protein